MPLASAVLMAAMEFKDDIEGEEALREMELEDAQAQPGQVALEQVPGFGAMVVAAVPAEAPKPASEALLEAPPPPAEVPA